MMERTLDRGAFIRLTGSLGAGLGFALYLPGRASQQEPTASSGLAPNAWVRVAPDETITVFVNKSEMGQGVATGLPTIVADAGGSTSVRDGWMTLRTAGATARAMLVAAAAKQWSVHPSACTTRSSLVYYTPSNRSATYGSLAQAAATLPVPAAVPLKTPDRFTLIGKHRPRPDIPLKVNGTAQYGIDVRVPNMLYAAIARSPVFGGRVKTFDARKSKAVAGVLHVVEISNGVAVVAKNTWSAFQGKLALQIVWDDGPNANVSTASLFREAEQLARTHAGEHVAVTRGNPDRHAGTVLEATYRGPFLAHATMEPQNATADVRADRCEVWAPTQVQTRAQAAAVKVTGLPPEKCIIHTTFLGGGFGRRLEADYVEEAVEVSKAVKAPVKVMWTREDDVQHDFYRPMAVNVVRGVIEDGALTTLTHQKVSQSWIRRWAPPFFKNGWDSLSLAETIDAPYAVPNSRVSFIDHEHGIPIGSWRSPDASWNAFVTESFIDELAHAARRDPLDFRLSLLKHNPRAAAALKLAAAKAGWGRKQHTSPKGWPLRTGPAATAQWSPTCPWRAARRRCIAWSQSSTWVPS